jgi:hypothetical protein
MRAGENKIGYLDEFEECMRCHNVSSATGGQNCWLTCQPGVHINAIKLQHHCMQGIPKSNPLA